MLSNSSPIKSLTKLPTKVGLNNNMNAFGGLNKSALIATKQTEVQKEHKEFLHEIDRVLIPSAVMMSQVEKGENPLRKFKPEKDKHGRYRERDIVGTNKLIYEGYKAKTTRIKKEKELEQHTSSTSNMKKQPKFSPN